MSLSIVKAHNFIAGEFREAHAGGWISIDDPATGEIVSEVADSGLMDVVGAVQAANKANGAWSKIDEAARAKLLARFADQLESQADSIAELEARETGVPLEHAKAVSLPRAVEVLRYYSRLLLDQTSQAVTNPQAYFIANRLPIGVVVVIASYSDPVARICASVGAALAAGNVVIVKASTRTPQTAGAIAGAAKIFPAGVFNLLQGRGTEVGRALVNHPGLSTISFTGRTDVAREIQTTGAEFLKRTQFNLSGSNAVLVFAENDLAKVAAKVAPLVFANANAVALRGARVLIQETVYDAFLELMKSEVEKLRAAPIVKPEDFEFFSKAVTQALNERAKLLCGGLDPTADQGVTSRGRFVRPTALYDLTFCSTLQQEEVIGPLATVASFKYQHDAIKHANNSPFGQAVYVFHANAAKAAKVALKLEAGRVFVNGGPLYDPRVSSGGLKTSGVGSQQGAIEALRFFSRETSIGFDIGS